MGRGNSCTPILAPIRSRNRNQTGKPCRPFSRGRADLFYGPSKHKPSAGRYPAPVFALGPVSVRAPKDRVQERLSPISRRLLGRVTGFSETDPLPPSENNCVASAQAGCPRDRLAGTPALLARPRPRAPRLRSGQALIPRHAGRPEQQQEPKRPHSRSLA